MTKKSVSKSANVWDQKSIPVLFRRERGNPLLVRLPRLDRDWLRDGKRRIPHWNAELGYWEVPVAWFDALIRRLIEEFGEVYVVQVYREYQKCVPACWNAQGLICECSCGGVNHGTGHPGGRWYAISESLAVYWSGRQYACRLITKRPEKKAAPKKRAGAAGKQKPRRG